jgi:hypothetical protein
MSNRVCSTLVLCCWFAVLLIILPPFGVGLQLEFCDSNVIDHFGCDASPILQITCSDSVYRENYLKFCHTDTHYYSSVCSSVLHIHHQDHSKVPFCPTKEKGLFHLLFSYDCGFHHLWQLHLHLHQTFSKGGSGH